MSDIPGMISTDKIARICVIKFIACVHTALSESYPQKSIGSVSNFSFFIFYISDCP